MMRLKIWNQCFGFRTLLFITVVIAVIFNGEGRELRCSEHEPSPQDVRIRLTGPDSQYLSGVVNFLAELDESLAEETTAVLFYLDGSLIHRSEAKPHNVVVDLGPEMLSHRISAVAIDRTSKRIEKADFFTNSLKVAYRDRVALVVIPTTVLDPAGFYRMDLEREDFLVYEDGIRQDLTCFGKEVVPASVALVLDTSKSMGGKMDNVTRAALKLIDLIAESDQVSILSFNDQLVMRCPFSSDKKLLRRSLKGIRPMGGTALYDAMYGSIIALRKSEGKRVLILFTDGHDEKYSRQAEAALRFRRTIAEAARENVAVYTIGLGKKVDTGMLSLIAEETGGFFFHLEKAKELEDVYARIFEELGSQYTLCYRPPAWGVPPSGEPVKRKIRVDVLREEPLIIRHKKGYFPSS